jgi:hypothetical protein
MIKSFKELRLIYGQYIQYVTNYVTFTQFDTSFLLNVCN